MTTPNSHGNASDSGGSPTPEMPEALHFGCGNSVGHFFHLPSGRMPKMHDSEMNARLPWEGHIDGCLWKVGSAEQGSARLFTKDGWTALVVADRSVDHRGGSHSTFLFHATLTFDEAVQRATKTFPHYVKRIGAIHADNG